MNTIFFSVSNSAGSAYSIKEFKKLGYKVVAGDADGEAVGRFLADEFYQLPYQNEDGYFDAVFHVIEEEEVSAFVPTGEQECLDASRMRDRFAEMNCTLVAANTRTLETSIDKALLFSAMTACDVKVPKWRPVREPNDFTIAVDALKDCDKLCMKPAVSSGSRGFVVIEEPDGAIFTRKVDFTRLPLETVRNVIARENFPPLLLMEYIDEPLYDSNLLAVDGKVIFQSVKTREQAVNGTITRGQIVRNDAISSANKRIASHLDTTGLISTQWAGDRLLEINPRWSTSLNYRNINEYLWSIYVWDGTPIKISADIVYQYLGLRMIRYWDVLTYGQRDCLREDTSE